MKIKLLTSATTLGYKNDVINVGKNLGLGLINRKQAIPYKADGLEGKTVKELQDIAKEKGISYSGLRKDDLIKELKEIDQTKEDKTGYQTK
jgi:hypothetical protein